jgi:hypothetical protein
MVTCTEHNSTNQANNSTAYLTEISIEPGQFSCEYLVNALDYKGRQQSGFFHKSKIKLFQGSEKTPSLEVRIIGLGLKDNWAFVKPLGGYFFESDNGIQVFASDLVYKSPED